MSEEKKKERKMKYEVPQLIKIGDVKAQGNCWNGSGDSASCDTGNSAGNCNTGNTASGGCLEGSSAGG